MIDDHIILKLNKYIYKKKINPNNEDIYNAKYNEHIRKINNMLNKNVKISFGGCSTVSEKLTNIISKLGEFNVIIHKKVMLLKNEHMESYETKKYIEQMCYIHDKTNMILTRIILLFFNYLKIYNELFEILKNGTDKSIPNFKFMQKITETIENISLDEINRENEILKIKMMLHGGGTEEFYEDENRKLNDEIAMMKQLFNEGNNLKKMSLRSLDKLTDGAIKNFDMAVKIFRQMFNNQNEILKLLIIKIKQRNFDKSIDLDTSLDTIVMDVQTEELFGGKLQPDGTIKIKNEIKTILNKMKLLDVKLSMINAKL